MNVPEANSMTIGTPESEVYTDVFVPANPFPTDLALVEQVLYEHMRQYAEDLRRIGRSIDADRLRHELDWYVFTVQGCDRDIQTFFIRILPWLHRRVWPAIKDDAWRRETYLGFTGAIADLFDMHDTRFLAAHTKTKGTTRDQ